MQKLNVQEILQKIDQYFENNEPKKAEEFMLEQLDIAMDDCNVSIVITLLNELIGYYRQTSEKERLLETIDKVLLVTQEAGLEDGVNYATTLLNIATGYRSIGELELSARYYQQVEDIYKKQLSENDMRMAGFYNNYSLLLQEKDNYVLAKKYQEKALSIALANEAGYEIASSYANLANTNIALQNWEEAEKYAQKAIGLFQTRGEKDAHYCGALSALAIANYEMARVQEGDKHLTDAIQTMGNVIGKNAQYDKLLEIWKQYHDGKKFSMDDIKSYENTHKTGLEICHAYYETYGIPMIQKYFPEYEKRIAVGLVGPGSDCLGFDDEISRDHDWGPGFCLFVTADTYEKIGAELQRHYDELPKEFMGYKRLETPMGKGRVGVKRIDEFYKNILNTDVYEEIDYSAIQDFALAVASNGEVFYDPEGIFSQMRQKLKQGYPEHMLYIKLAEDAAKFAQAGQYNYARIIRRGDFMTADYMLYQSFFHAMRLVHHLNNQYSVHDKWLRESTRKQEHGEEVLAYINQILSLHKKIEAERLIDKTEGNELSSITEATLKVVTDAIEELGAFLAKLLYDYDYISDIESYLGEHVDELLRKAEYANYSNTELVKKIAKLEFEAFDKVQNEGGRASCQNNWPTFSVMRRSQYMTWNRTMLLQYYYDFGREYARGHNLITEKYGRMMESTANSRYEAIKEHFPELSEQKKAVIEQIVALQMGMMERFAEEHPGVADNARSLHTYEDNFMNTSYETYLRGEISTYSDKMLQLYGRFVVECVSTGKNIARMTIENTAKLYGYVNLEAFENRMQ